MTTRQQAIAALTNDRPRVGITLVSTAKGFVATPIASSSNAHPKQPVLLTSSSSGGISVHSVGTVSTANKPKVKQEVRDVLEGFTKPSNTQQPVVLTGSGQQRITQYALQNGVNKHAVAAAQLKQQQAAAAAQAAADDKKNQPALDFESQKGVFGWVTFRDSVHIPYLLRRGDKFVSVRMMEHKLLKKYLEFLPTEYYNCAFIKSYYITAAETKLLNEINAAHCDFQFGREAFINQEGKGDLVVKLADANHFDDYLETCYAKTNTRSGAVQISASSACMRRCGFVKIGSLSVPYVRKDDVQYVPTFYFEKSYPQVLSKLKRVKLETWDVSYLKFCAKTANIKTDFLAPDGTSCMTVGFNELFDGLTKVQANLTYSEYWPSNKTITIGNGSSARVYQPQLAGITLVEKPDPKRITIQQVQKPTLLPGGATLTATTRTAVQRTQQNGQVNQRVVAPRAVATTAQRIVSTSSVPRVVTASTLSSAWPQAVSQWTSSLAQQLQQANAGTDAMNAAFLRQVSVQQQQRTSQAASVNPSYSILNQSQVKPTTLVYTSTGSGNLSQQQQAAQALLNASLPQMQMTMNSHPMLGDLLSRSTVTATQPPTYLTSTASGRNGNSLFQHIQNGTSAYNTLSDLVTLAKNNNISITSGVNPTIRGSIVNGTSLGVNRIQTSAPGARMVRPIQPKPTMAAPPAHQQMRSPTGDIVDLISPIASPQLSSPKLPPTYQWTVPGSSQQVLLREIPEDEVNDAAAFSISRLKLERWELHVVNSRSYVRTSELLASLNEVAAVMFSHTSRSACVTALQALQLPLYKANSNQVRAFGAYWKKAIEEPLVLIQVSDVMKFMPQLKFIISSSESTQKRMADSNADSPASKRIRS